MTMRAAVAAIFLPYTIEHEGMLAYPYADGINKVTVGPGILVDDGTDRMMLAQPWKIRGAFWSNKEPVGTRRATPAEVSAAYKSIKAHPYQGKHPAGGLAYEGVTNLTLDMADIRKLYDGKIAEAERYLDQTFPRWETWPADAQLATMTMVWAMGDPAAKGFRKWADALNHEPPDFARAAKESAYTTGYGRIDGIPGTSANERNRALYMQAADTQRDRGDYDQLHVTPVRGFTAVERVGLGGIGDGSQDVSGGPYGTALLVENAESGEGAESPITLVGLDGRDDGPARTGQLYPKVQTKVSKAQFLASAERVLPDLPYSAIGVMWAQYAFETARGDSCFNFNLGGVKKQTGDGFDYTMYPTWEIIDGKKVTFTPPHPATWFRAFLSLDEGMAAQAAVVKKRYGDAWGYIERGEPDGYARALKAKGYYTGDEDVYASALRSLHNEWMRKPDTPGVPAKPVPPGSVVPAPKPGELTGVAATAFPLTTILGLGAIGGVGWWAWHKSRPKGKG